MDTLYNPAKGWEYDKHPHYPTVNESCSQIISELINDTEKQYEIILDTRESHRDIFCNVTPVDCNYFAGNYRGSCYKFLENYSVKIAGYDGCSPQDVHEAMIDFSKNITPKFEVLCDYIRDHEAVSQEKKLVVFCRFLSIVFVQFLAIHPYANGNGHIGRLIVWIFLKKLGFSQDFWSVNDRPGEPRGVPLDRCIRLFRQDKKEYLIKYFLQGIKTGMPVTQENFKP